MIEAMQGEHCFDASLGLRVSPYKPLDDAPRPQSCRCTIEFIFFSCMMLFWEYMLVSLAAWGLSPCLRRCFFGNETLRFRARVYQDTLAVVFTGHTP